MSTTGIIADFFFNAFNIDPTQFWPALVGGLLAGSLVGILVDFAFGMLLEKANQEKGLAHFLAFVSGATFAIYLWYSGIWAVITGFTLLMFGAGAFLLVIFVVWGFYHHAHGWVVEKEAEHIKAKKIRAEEKAGYIEQVADAENKFVEARKKLEKELYKNLLNAYNNAVNQRPTAVVEKLRDAQQVSREVIDLLMKQKSTMKWYKDRKLRRLINKEIKTSEELYGDINSALTLAQQGKMKEVEKVIKKNIKIIKKEIKEENKEEKRIEKEKPKFSIKQSKAHQAVKEIDDLINDLNNIQLGKPDFSKKINNYESKLKEFDKKYGFKGQKPLLDTFKGLLKKYPVNFVKLRAEFINILDLYREYLKKKYY